MRRMRYGGAAWFSLKHVARSLRRAPAFSIAVTVVLAIGIAGATVVYSVAEALLFREIPYADPETLCLVSITLSAGEGLGGSHVLHWELFERLREGHSRFLQSVAAYSSRDANLSGDGWSERSQVGSVTPGFLPLLGVRPSAGRGFVEAEFQAGRHHVAMLSHALWQARFGAASDVIGRVIVVDDTPYTVVGVLPVAFRSVDELETGTPAAWLDSRLGVLIPLVVDPRFSSRVGSTGSQTLRILARLRDVRMLAAARSEVEALGRQLEWGRTPARISYTLSPITTALNQGVPARMALLGAAVAVLLLLACANAALLMLERRESRRRELEIRAALGATRTQLVAEAVVEAMLLGTTAGMLGVACAWEGVAVARTAGGAVLTGLAATRFGWRVVLFALGVSLATALLASLGSCLRLLQAGAIYWAPVRGGSRVPPFAGSLPTSIVVAQIGLSVGLVVVGAVLTGDFARQAAVDVGYHPKGVLTARMALSPRRHPDGGRQFLDLVLERLRGVPAVDDVALVFPGPGVPIAQALRGRVEGHGEESLGLRVVSRSYFSLLRIPILAGRAFTEADVTGAEPVVVVNEAFAKRYWGSARSAVGQRIATGLGRERTWGAPVTVIGVAGDIREASMMMQPEMCITYSWAIQRRLGVSEVSFLLKGAEGKLPGLAIRLKRLVEEVDPYQPLYGVRALEDLVGAILIRTRLLLVVVAVFSVLATLLAAVGVYVVIAFAVTRRTQEFGIRLALGASRCDVLRLVLGQTVRLVGKGVILTLPLTFGAIWLSAAQLFGVTDTDPLACLWAVGIVGVAAVLASVAPAWRAIRLDPSTALRQE